VYLDFFVDYLKNMPLATYQDILNIERKLDIIQQNYIILTDKIQLCDQTILSYAKGGLIFTITSSLLMLGIIIYEIYTTSRKNKTSHTDSLTSPLLPLSKYTPPQENQQV